MLPPTGHTPHCTALLQCVALLLMLLLHTVVSSRLTLLDVTSEVNARHQRTLVRAVARNPQQRARELICRLDLPPAAYITKLIIEADGQNHTSSVRRRGRRRRGGGGGGGGVGGGDGGGSGKGEVTRPTSPQQNFFTIKKREGGPQRFRASATVSSQSEVIFYLSYEQVLHRSKGSYTSTFYFAPSQRVASVTVRLTVKEVEPMVFARLLAVPGGGAPEQALESGAAVLVHAPNSNYALVSYSSERDPTFEEASGHSSGLFSFAYDVERKPDGGELQVSGNHFVLYFAPEGLPGLTKHTVFVLDISGSMEEAGKLDHLKDAMEAILEDFQPEDSFQIIVFSTNVRSLGVFKAQGQELKRGIYQIRNLEAYGGTNINEALLRGLKDITAHEGSQQARQIVFLTDGNPTVNERDTDVIRRNVREANTRRYPIFALAFGPDAELRFLRQISADNNGIARRITNKGSAAEQIKNFFDEVSTPLITDVSVRFPPSQVNQSSLVKLGQNTFYDGDEVVYAGQLTDGTSQVDPSVEGVGRDGPLELKVSRRHTAAPTPPNPDLQRIWAYLAVQDLLDSQDVVEEENLRSEMRARALHIALMNGFVTRLTSLAMSPGDLDTDFTPEDPSSSTPDTRPTTAPLPPHPHQQPPLPPLGRLLPHSAGDITLMSKEDVAASLPTGLRASLGATQNRRFSFVDNDPHFVVQVPGLTLPLCFDVHGNHGDTLSIIRDPKSGITVSGEVTAAAGREHNTYFTRLFIVLGPVNITVTPTSVKVDCLYNSTGSMVSGAWTNTWKSKQSANRSRRHNKNRNRSKKHRASRLHMQTLPEEADSFDPSLSEVSQVDLSQGDPSQGDFSQGDLTPGYLTRSRGFPGSHSFRQPFHLNRIHHHHHPRNKRSLVIPFVTDRSPSRNTQTSKEETSPLESETSDEDESDYLDEMLESLDAESLEDEEREKLKYEIQQLFGTGTIPENLEDADDIASEGIYSDGEIHYRRTTVPILRRSQTSHRRVSPTPTTTSNYGQLDNLVEKCQHEMNWEEIFGRRYDDVQLQVRNNRKLNIMMGDLEVHFTVTRTKNRHGQHFLGFYVEEQNVLSPLTTGIIGQFAFKTVTVKRPTRPGRVNPSATEDLKNTVDLLVLHVGEDGGGGARISEVRASVEKRRSLLHKVRVPCLYVNQQGRGLLTHPPQAYTLPCLHC